MSAHDAEREWIKNNSINLEKLKDWLQTEVKIVAIDTDGKKTYDGNILELIQSVSGMLLNWICEFIKKIQKDGNINDEQLKELIYATILHYDRVYQSPRMIDGQWIKGQILIDTYESKKRNMYVTTLTSNDISYLYNIETLCKKIRELDTDQLTALHNMLCQRNEKGQSMFSWAAWSMLADENRATKGYKRVYQQTADLVGPWIKSSGGRRTRHKKRSGNKNKKHSRSKRRSSRRH